MRSLELLRVLLRIFMQRKLSILLMNVQHKVLELLCIRPLNITSLLLSNKKHNRSLLGKMIQHNQGIKQSSNAQA